MPKLSDTAVPRYRLARQSGQAVVTLNGKAICLGVHGMRASKDRCGRLIARPKAMA